jgi:hypothetical protein
MADDREERIRKRAHEMWERDGFPEGQDQAHWHDAAREIDAEIASGSGETPEYAETPETLAAKPEADIHGGDEGGAGLGGTDVTGAEGGVKAKPARAKSPRKSASAKADAKPAAKATKTTARKPRAKKGDAGGAS